MKDVEVIREFVRIIRDPSSLELRDIHHLLEENIWLVNDCYSVYASNKSLSSVIKDKMQKKHRPRRKRPDLICMDNRNDYIIIELKRPNHTVNLSDVTQVFEYTIITEMIYPNSRMIEGYLLGLCLLLIWPELGSVKTKGFRLSLYWFFFLGYMTLFWGLDMNVEILGITFDAPDLLQNIGGQLAILLSLGALYMTGPLPTTLGREIEMEDLDFDFDERQVKKTVDAFVGAEDFASIRSQLDIIDASVDVSDSELDDILGDEFKEMLPLRRVPGIGESLEKKLNAAGYESAAQIAGESAQRLAQKVDGLSIARAEKILKDARRVVKKTVKKNKRK